MKIVSAIVCDDVRREMNGKDILIGVYPGAIVVPNLPFNIPLAVWMEVVPDSLGHHSVDVRLSYAGQIVLTAQAGVDIHAFGTISLPIVGMGLTSDKLGEIVIEYSEDKTKWTEIKRKKIIQGTVASIIAPTAPSG